MAEFNIFLGTAKKSVGDVTLMRRNGRQIARVRVRSIANPRSEAQSIQRNFVAPVTRFFAPFRKVLRCSWEGMNRDLSYNQFQRVNIKLAQTNGWWLEKGAQFTPMPYQLSRGRLTPVPYAIQTPVNVKVLVCGWDVPSFLTNTIGRISQPFLNNGYKTGDVVTIILIARDSDGIYTPYSSQFILNAADTRRTSSVLGDYIAVSSLDTKFLFALNDQNTYAGAIVISRYDDGRWLRSTQFLAVDADLITWLQSDAQRSAAIASYMAGGSDDSGGVYPGGSDEQFVVAARDGRALLFIGTQCVSQVIDISGTKVIKVKPDNLDDYYYILKENTYPLGTNAAGSTNPADWRFVSVYLADVTESNSISWVAGNSLDQWLRTCGYTGA